MCMVTKWHFITIKISPRRGQQRGQGHMGGQLLSCPLLAPPMLNSVCCMSGRHVACSSYAVRIIKVTFWICCARAFTVSKHFFQYFLQY